MSANAADDAVDARAAGRSFVLLAGAFALLMSFMTVPTPLYGLYEERDGFGPFVLTLVFAAYGFGVAVALFFLGHVSDHVGRRRVTLAVVVLEVVAALLFPLLQGTPGLLVLRALTGIGVGAVSATLTAHLGELYGRWRPESDGRWGRTVATSVNVGGLGLGPIIAALLSRLGDPLVVPYLVYAVAMLAAGAVVWLAPETVPADRIAEHWSYRPQRASVEPDLRAPFLGAAVAALAGFAVLGFITALTGRFLVEVVDVTSRVAIGAVASTIVLAGALSQVLLATVGQRRRLQLGAVLVALGMVVVAIAALTATLSVFVIGGVLASGGVGLVFAASVATVAGLSAPERRGETLAALFLAAYVGITVPVVALGVALTAAGTVPVTVAFAAVVFVAVPAGISVLLRATPVE